MVLSSSSSNHILNRSSLISTEAVNSTSKPVAGSSVMDLVDDNQVTVGSLTSELLIAFLFSFYNYFKLHSSIPSMESLSQVNVK